MRNCDIKFVNKEITPFGGLSLFFKMLDMLCKVVYLFKVPTVVTNRSS